MFLKNMHPFFKRLEHFTDRIIPYLLFLLGIIITLEFGFKAKAELYYTYILAADWIIIFFFCLDLIFKYNRIRKFKPFIKRYWLDIIAVFPFFLLVRAVEEILLLFRISEEVSAGQKFLHVGVEVEKIAKEEAALKELSALQKETRVFKEIEAGTQLSRTRMFARFLRLPRFIKVFPFYEKPIKHEIKVIEKDIKKEERKIKRDVRKIKKKFKKSKS